MNEGERPRAFLGGETLDTYPLLVEKISSLAWIMGESHDSGHNSGFNGGAKSREIVADSRTVLGREILGMSQIRDQG